MRIQHNILAMNAYRNYGNNTSALGKNLEKLSSGYKINRAGDDAAGLAISEKMRAQIQGLNAAQKNVKDGISLIKTAEGAMQEIQDMLSRMKYLATQSANGTYDKEVDRQNLQAEVDQLIDEIDRIADSANFNDIYMLKGGGAADQDNPQTGAATAAANTPAVAAATPAVAAKYVFDLSGQTALSAGESVTIAGVTINAGSGADIDTDSHTNVTDQVDDIVTALNNDGTFSASYTASATAGKLTITAKTAGVDANAANVTTSWNGTTVAKDATESVDGAAEVPDTTDPGNTEAPKKYAATLTVPDGKTFKDGDKVSIGGADYEFGTGTGKVDITGKTTVADQMNAVVDAYNAAQTDFTAAYDATSGKITFTATDTNANPDTAPAFTVTSADGITATAATEVTEEEEGDSYAIDLQIGDTSQPYNILNVKIGSMKAAAVGVGTVDISTQGAASKAIDQVKKAINYVSSIRGDLGAYQNRLEHTASNLSVMTENIQDAESTIRDTDVADEMMAYTKNNILIQSAQAMLAQANAVPQGVLQLLQ